MNEPISFGWLFVKTVVAMIFIICLALISIKFLLPRVAGRRGRGDSRIKILDMQPLELRKSVYIVEIEGRRIALGVSDHAVNFLYDLGASFAAVEKSVETRASSARTPATEESYKPKA